MAQYLLLKFKSGYPNETSLEGEALDGVWLFIIELRDHVDSLT
jgi:hypothetical protein